MVESLFWLNLFIAALEHKQLEHVFVKAGKV